MLICDAPVAFNKIYFAICGLKGDTFVTLTFQFESSDLPKQTAWNGDFIERLFIAGSLSFFD